MQIKAETGVGQEGGGAGSTTDLLSFLEGSEVGGKVDSH